MLYINDFRVHIPDFTKDIKDLHFETNLTTQMLSIYKKIYGLKKIAMASNNSLFDFINVALKELMSSIDYNIDYVIYAHTASLPIPFINTLFSSMINTYKQFANACFINITNYKCIGFFKSLCLTQKLLSSRNINNVLVLTGEIAYTPLLRVVPRTSLVSDAATASLLSSNSSLNNLRSVVIKYLRGYSAGIYVSSVESMAFDKAFVENMVGVIESAIVKAGITAQNIKLILPHNVNVPTWKKICVSLNLPLTKFFIDNISKYAHCFCSDPIINLKTVTNLSMLSRGDYYLMAACGMGFYFAAAVFQY